MTEFRIYRNLEELPPDFWPSAITIGNFDGLHSGHRRIMRRVVEVARMNGWIPAALTFDPHPTRVVAPAKCPALLTTTEQRARLMREEGIEAVVILPFTPELSRFTPEQFIAEVVARRLRARAILVGYNFRFGANHAGDIDTLNALSGKYGYETEVVAGVQRRGLTVSSTAIRQLIRAGNVLLAGRFLERVYGIEGEIVQGRGIGSKQTVPTLNLAATAEVLPANGVYVTRTYDLDSSRVWDSVTNIGLRPTFGGDSLSIETFLLQPLTGDTPRRIRVEFLWRLRDERKFDSPEALKAQILKDVGRAQAFLRRIRRWVRPNPLLD